MSRVLPRRCGQTNEEDMVQWLLVSSGRGPVECERFVQHLVGVIRADAVAVGLACDLAKATPGEVDGTLASALLSFEGDGAEAMAARWAGTHKWVCQSPFRPNHRRKNWFVGVSAITPPTVAPWREEELRVETFRSSGPGGQHANKTSSAVRVTHVPTGLSVVSQEERSQRRNRTLALARLAEAFDNRKEQREADAEQACWMEHAQVERGAEVSLFKGKDFRRVR